VCSATHYNCAYGNLGSVQEYSNRYEWWCNGVNGDGGIGSQLCQEMKVTITGQVYIDYNGNGAPDGPDVGMGGITVWDGANAPVATNANGDYTISNVTPGTYSVSITETPGYTVTYPSPYPPTVYATNPSNTQNFGIKPPGPICDGGIATANPAQIYVGGNPPPTTSNLSVANCRDGTGALGTVTYAWATPIQGTISPTNAASVTYFPPAAYSTYTQINVAPSLFVCNPGGAGAACTPFGANLTLIPTFTARGQVYVDNDKNGVLNPAVDSAYPGGASISICRVQGGNCNTIETLTTNGSGNFTTVGNIPLTSGTYKATLTVPSPYQPITPKPPTALFTVGNASTGASCSVPSYAGCDANGNAINLNFGISDSFVWMQAVGGDITGNYISDSNKGGFTNTIPTSTNITNGACSASATGPYTMINGVGGTHGLINTGFKDATFGQGQLASAKAWLVGGSAGNSYAYNMPLSKQTKTAYANLSYLVKQSNVSTTDLATLANCGIPSTSCNLPPDNSLFPSKVYTVNGDLTLNGTNGTYTFPIGQYVILVNGKININTKIVVPVGSFVLFSASGDINVAATVGDTYNIATSNLEGYYSTDKSFNILGKNSSGNGANCATTNNEDLRLNVAGSIIVNASTINGGSFNYSQRDMCAYDKQCPVFTISERPDFILNSPTFLMFPRRVWQEVAP
jgi:hypothetical protein